MWPVPGAAEAAEPQPSPEGDEQVRQRLHEGEELCPRRRLELAEKQYAGHLTFLLEPPPLGGGVCAPSPRGGSRITGIYQSAR